MPANRHQTTRDTNLRPLFVLGEIVILRLQIRCIVRDLEAMSERRYPHRTECVHLFAAHAHHLIQILLGGICCDFSFFRHPCSLLLNIHDFVLN